jgi:drug/metabolite transporter (DMT)-like permease
MAKILLVLIVAAIIESAGVIILTRGLKELQGVREITVSEIVRVVKSVVTNGKILGGTALEAIFYASLLYLLSKSDVSFIWPLTSLGFIFTTLAAEMFFNEKVTATRWAGVLLIAVGVCLISYSEKVKGREAPPPGKLGAVAK